MLNMHKQNDVYLGIIHKYRHYYRKSISILGNRVDMDRESLYSVLINRGTGRQRGEQSRTEYSFY